MLKVAVTDSSAVTVTVHAALPVHASVQPAKKDPLPAAAVSFTLVPELKLALQVGVQLTPAGLLVTSPLPPPATVTLSRNELAGELACGSGAWVRATSAAPGPPRTAFMTRQPPRTNARPQAMNRPPRQRNIASP